MKFLQKIFVVQRPAHHGQGRGDEHLGVRGELLLEQQDEGEGDSAPEAAVHHDQLLGPAQLLDAELVGEEGEDEDSDYSAHTNTEYLSTFTRNS